jgi:membrane AbrB-like protein
LCGLSAWLLTALLHIDPLTAYLATSPGGLDSMILIAMGSGTDVAFVVAVQTLRLFVVILTGPAIARAICRYA